MTAVFLGVGAVLIGVGFVLAIASSTIAGILMLVAGVGIVALALSGADVPNRSANEPFHGRESTTRSRPTPPPE